MFFEAIDEFLFEKARDSTGKLCLSAGFVVGVKCRLQNTDINLRCLLPSMFLGSPPYIFKELIELLVFQSTKVIRGIKVQVTNHGGGENVDEHISYAAVKIPNWRREGCVVRAIRPENWQQRDI